MIQGQWCQISFQSQPMYCRPKKHSCIVRTTFFFNLMLPTPFSYTTCDFRLTDSASNILQCCTIPVFKGDCFPLHKWKVWTLLLYENLSSTNFEYSLNVRLAKDSGFKYYMIACSWFIFSYFILCYNEKSSINLQIK